MPKRRRRYKFKPNKNTALVLVVLILFILMISGIRSLTKYDKSLRGAEYSHEEVRLPEYQVRACISEDGTPTADYFKIYPHKKGEKIIYLTFDDGPSSNVTPQILDILKRYNVEATFFVIAQNAEKNPDIIRRAVSEGHSVASHSYGHNYSYMYESVENFKEEINHARDVLKKILGEDKFTDIFRFPGGAFGEDKKEFKEILISENIPYINWNSLTGDTETARPVSADLVSRAKLSGAKASSGYLVMLMHDAGAKQASADALPAIIEHFQGEGYEFRALKRR